MYKHYVQIYISYNEHITVMNISLHYHGKQVGYTDIYNKLIIDLS